MPEFSNIARHVCRNFFPSWDLRNFNVEGSSCISFHFFLLSFFLFCYYVREERTMGEGNIEASSFSRSIFVSVRYFYIAIYYYSSPRANFIATFVATFLRFEKFPCVSFSLSITFDFCGKVFETSLHVQYFHHKLRRSSARVNPILLVSTNVHLPG